MAKKELKRCAEGEGGEKGEQENSDKLGEEQFGKGFGREAEEEQVSCGLGCLGNDQAKTGRKGCDRAEREKQANDGHSEKDGVCDFLDEVLLREFPVDLVILFFELAKESIGRGSFDLDDNARVKVIYRLLLFENFGNRHAIRRAAYGGSLSFFLLVIR